jgi:hypothetical protein
MFRLLAFVFWFSLLFGTYITGNGIGNWIALLALVLLFRFRRRNAQTAAAAAVVGKGVTATPSAARATTSPNAEHAQPRLEPAASGTRSSQTPRRRWR